MNMGGRSTGINLSKLSYSCRLWSFYRKEFLISLVSTEFGSKPDLEYNSLFFFYQDLGIDNSAETKCYENILKKFPPSETSLCAEAYKSYSLHSSIMASKLSSGAVALKCQGVDLKKSNNWGLTSVKISLSLHSNAKLNSCRSYGSQSTETKECAKTSVDCMDSRCVQCSCFIFFICPWSLHRDDM